MKTATRLAFLAATSLASPTYADIGTAEMIAARQHIFGAENVDPDTGALPADKVIFSWLSASSFAGRGSRPRLYDGHVCDKDGSRARAYAVDHRGHN